MNFHHCYLILLKPAEINSKEIINIFINDNFDGLEFNFICKFMNDFMKINK